jgi:hypothetical protein
MSANMKTVLRTLTLYLVMAASAVAQTPAEEIDYETARFDKNIVAVRITEEISMDGLLDEPAWDLATPATDFVQRRPNPGAPSGERTEVRVLFDDDNLYVGFYCFDSQPDRIVVNDLEEDFNFRGSDGVTLAIDSRHDLRSGFLFVANPAGAKSDGQVSLTRLDLDWDGVWDVGASRDDEGWYAEFVIPFKTLRFTLAESQEWGINFNRRVIRLNEDSDWAPIPIRYNISRVSQYGTLRGLEGIRQGRNLTVTPFVTAGVTQVRAENNTLKNFETDQNYDAGVDLKYSLTPSVTLDATYRTDFAQVEVDQQQVNLTRFNLFFPEKRDFFLENSSTFDFGADRNLVPFFSRRIGLSGSGTPIPILGGGRVTGQIGRYDVGFLAMKTERLDTTPANSYVVGRIKRNLLANSWAGAIVTNRDSTIEGDYNRVYGGDLHFQFYDRLVLDSHILRSDTPGLSGQDQARQFQAAWRDDELTIAAGYNEIQANFNPEVGFVRRKNNTRYNGQFSWNPLIESSPVFRNLVFGTSLDYYEDGATKQIGTRDASLNLGVRFEDNSLVDFSLLRTFDRLTNPFRIRSDISILEGDYSYTSYSARATTNPGRKISGNARIEWGEFWSGRRRSFTGGVRWRPNFHLQMEADYRRNQVNLANGKFTTNLVGARVLYAFTPDAFLNAFFQYNTDSGQVSSNIRFNIIHHPLSDFFLVYNDLRDSHTGEVLQRAVTLKLTNLFNF